VSPLTGKQGVKSKTSGRVLPPIGTANVKRAEVTVQLVDTILTSNGLMAE
jgi:hypothetical protein